MEMIDKSYCIGCEVVTTELVRFGASNLIASQGCWDLFNEAVTNYFNFESTLRLRVERLATHLENTKL